MVDEFAPFYGDEAQHHRGSDKSIHHTVGNKFDHLNPGNPEWVLKIITAVEPRYVKGDSLNHITARTVMGIIMEQGFNTKTPEGRQVKQFIVDLATEHMDPFGWNYVWAAVVTKFVNNRNKIAAKAKFDNYMQPMTMSFNTWSRDALALGKPHYGEDPTSAFGILVHNAVETPFIRGLRDDVNSTRTVFSSWKDMVWYVSQTVIPDALKAHGSEIPNEYRGVPELYVNYNRHGGYTQPNSKSTPTGGNKNPNSNKGKVDNKSKYGNNKKPYDSSKKCNKCNFVGHATEDHIDTKPRYPEGTCYGCGKTGHIRADCPTNPTTPKTGVLEAAIKNGADKKAIEDSKEVKEDDKTSTTPKEKDKSKSKPPSSPNKKDGTTG
jgi:hypothetical protein